MEKPEKIDKFFSKIPDVEKRQKCTQNRLFLAAIKMASTGSLQSVEDIDTLHKVAKELPPGLYAYPVNLIKGTLGLVYYHTNNNLKEDKFSRVALKKPWDKNESKLRHEGFNTQIGMAYQLSTNRQRLITVNLGESLSRELIDLSNNQVSKDKRHPSASAKLAKEVRDEFKNFPTAILICTSLENGLAGLYSGKESANRLHIHIVADVDHDTGLSIKKALQKRFDTDDEYINTQSKQAFFTPGAIDYTDSNLNKGSSYTKAKNKALANALFFASPNSGKPVSFETEASNFGKAFHDNLYANKDSLLKLYDQICEHVRNTEEPELDQLERYFLDIAAE